MITLSGNQAQAQKAGGKILQEDLGYDYPHGLDLRPGSDLHERILREVNERAQTSANVMARYKPRWQDIDEVLRVYMPPERVEGDTEKQKRARKNKDYADLIIPESYATMETILTYYMTSFMQDPIFKYEGVGPEDVVGARLMTHLIDHQAKRSRMGLNIHTQLRDDTAYGFGVLAPTWRRYYGKKPKVRSFGRMNEMGVFEIIEEKRDVENNAILYEGNELMNINPYLYLPDVSVPIHEPEKGSYQGWVEETTVNNLMKIEHDPQSLLFNVRYLKELDNRSQWSMTRKQKTRGTNDTNNATGTLEADVIWMYIDLIPSDWGMGDSDYPEKWMFAVGGDKVVNCAEPVDYLHGRTPIVVCASGFDGYSVTPVSKLSMVQDIQTLINFMYTSHIHNVRKSLNDMFIVDPSIINYYDIINPEPGKVIRTRRAAWGNQMLDHAFKQLDVKDVTQQHVGEAQMLGELMRRVSASDSNMQGSFANRTSRISSREAGQVMGAALSRYQKNAQIIDMQSMHPLGTMLAAHVQQFMQEETYVKVTGDWPSKYYMDLADIDERIPVHPMDLMVEYDIMPTYGEIPGSEDPQVWTQIFQYASANPVVAQQLDWMKLIKHIAWNMGAKNIDDFIVRVSPDEEVLQQQAAGNILPNEQA